MIRFLAVCAVFVFAFALPASAKSIGTYSGCKKLGGAKNACMACVSGGNFFQSGSNVCGLGAKKPATPKPVATPTPDAPTTAPTKTPSSLPKATTSTTKKPTTTASGGCGGCQSMALLPLVGLLRLRRRRNR